MCLNDIFFKCLKSVQHKCVHCIAYSNRNVLFKHAFVICLLLFIKKASRYNNSTEIVKISYALFILE